MFEENSLAWYKSSFSYLNLNNFRVLSLAKFILIMTINYKVKIFRKSSEVNPYKRITDLLLMQK